MDAKRILQTTAIICPEEVPEEAKKRTPRTIWSLYVETAIFCARALKSIMKRLEINWRKRLRRRSYVSRLYRIQPI